MGQRLGRRGGVGVGTVLAGAVLVMTLHPGQSRAAGEGLAVLPREHWGCVFADREVGFHFTVQSSESFQGRAAWVLVIDRRMVPGSVGEAAITAGPDKPARVAVRLRTPPVRAGIILRAQLTVSVYRPGQEKPQATFPKDLWIFPPEPFAGRQEWLKRLKLGLFDPEKTTAEAFQKINLPFETLDNLAAIGERKEGLVVVGQGVSFKDYPELPGLLIQAAARGLAVLCLAPAEGTFPLPGTEEAGLAVPQSLAFRHRDVIRALDKRLDVEAWPPAGRVLAGTLLLKAEENRVLAEASRETKGWPWVEVRFASGGRLLVCGFGLMGRSWDAGPVPRFLLARTLERLAANPPQRPE